MLSRCSLFLVLASFAAALLLLLLLLPRRRLLAPAPRSASPTHPSPILPLLCPLSPPPLSIFFSCAASDPAPPKRNRREEGRSPKRTGPGPTPIKIDRPVSACAAAPPQPSSSGCSPPPRPPSHCGHSNPQRGQKPGLYFHTQPTTPPLRASATQTQGAQALPSHHTDTHRQTDRQETYTKNIPNPPINPRPPPLVF